MSQLKPQDLRYGNLIEFDGKIFTVKAIDKHIATADRGKGNVDFTYSEINPIPLTEDWLLKAGFKHTGGGFYTHLPSLIQACNISDQFYNIGFKDANIGRFYYLNQLQNLFHSLTSEELEINLK